MNKKTKILIFLLIAFIFLIVTVLGINFYVKASVKSRIINIKQAKKLRGISRRRLRRA